MKISERTLLFFLKNCTQTERYALVPELYTPEMPYPSVKYKKNLFNHSIVLSDL